MINKVAFQWFSQEHFVSVFMFFVSENVFGQEWMLQFSDRTIHHNSKLDLSLCYIYFQITFERFLYSQMTPHSSKICDKFHLFIFKTCKK